MASLESAVHLWRAREILNPMSVPSSKAKSLPQVALDRTTASFFLGFLRPAISAIDGDPLRPTIWARLANALYLVELEDHSDCTRLA